MVLELGRIVRDHASARIGHARQAVHEAEHLLPLLDGALRNVVDSFVLQAEVWDVLAHERVTVGLKPAGE